MKLTIDKASIIVDQALAHARANKIRPLCVAVLDDGGHVKALKRDDGASILRPTDMTAFLSALSDMSGGSCRSPAAC